MANPEAQSLGEAIRQSGIGSMGSGASEEMHNEPRGRGARAAGQSRIYWQHQTPCCGWPGTQQMKSTMQQCIQTKKPQNIQIVTQNLGGLPTAEEGEVKYTNLQHFTAYNKMIFLHSLNAALIGMRCHTKTDCWPEHVAGGRVCNGQQPSIRRRHIHVDSSQAEWQ